jgi:hypothetical protein
MNAIVIAYQNLIDEAVRDFPQCFTMPGKTTDNLRHTGHPRAYSLSVELDDLHKQLCKYFCGKVNCPCSNVSCFIKE